MGSKNVTTLVYNSIKFSGGSITDASFTVPQGTYGNTLKCLLFIKNSSTLSNISIVDAATTVVNKLQTFKLSNTVSGVITSSNFFATGSVCSFKGYISGLTLTCTDTSVEPLQICPTFKVTGTGVAANTIITRQVTLSNVINKTNFSGIDGTYRINNSQTVGSAVSPIEFICIPQNTTFIGALTVDASNNTNKTTTSLYINQGNAYISESFPLLGMTLTGNAIKYGGNSLSNVQIYNRASGSASVPYINVITNSTTDVSTYTSTVGEVLLTTFLDASGCKFKGYTSGNILTAISIFFGTIKLGHFLTGETLTTPPPTISSFVADGSYTFTRKCEIINNILTVMTIPTSPTGNDAYVIPNFVSKVAVSPSPVNFYIYISGSSDISGNTYVLGYGASNTTGKGTGAGKSVTYALNQNVKKKIKDTVITFTVQTTNGSAGSGSIGQYILSSSQPTTNMDSTKFLLTGPEIIGTLI